MRSKTSFFNPTLFKKNLTRFWPLWGGVSALGALVPLYLLMTLIESGFRSAAGKGLQATTAYYEVLTYGVPIFSLFYAALCALAVWHYLYNTRSVGLFHSLPITRKGLFVTNFLSGMAMMLIPYAVAGGLCVLITIPAGLFEPVGVLVTILGVLGDSLFYFAAATLVIFVTGNPFAFAAFYFIFHFLAAGMEWLLSQLMTEFYLGVNQAYTGVVEFLSPTIYLCGNIHVWPEFEQIPTPGGWIENGHMISVTLRGGWLIGVYALVGVVLLGLAWLLYQRRRSESAGDVVAVGWMKPVFRYGVALCAALTGGTALYVIFVNHRYALTARAVPFAFCMAVAGVVGYYIASMLLAKSLRVFRRSGKGVLLTVIASAGICFAIAADPFGVESWVPETDELMEARVSIYSPYGRGLGVDVFDPSEIQKLVDLHETILAEKDGLEDQWRSGNFDCSVQLYLSYWTPTDHVRRDYTLFLSDTPSPAVRLAMELASDPEFQERNIFGEVTPSQEWNDIAEARLTGGSVGTVYNTETQEITDIDLTQEQARELEAAVRRDIQAGHFGKTMFLNDYDTYQESVYAGEFYLNYNLVYRRSDPNARNSSGSYRDTGGRSVYFTISTYCTETIKALEDMGVLDRTHRLPTQMEFNSMEQTGDGKWIYSVYSEDAWNSAPHTASAVYPEDRAVYPEKAY